MNGGRVNLGQAIIQFWMHASRTFDLNHMIDCGEVGETIESYDSSCDLVPFRRMLHQGVPFKPDSREVVDAAGKFHDDAYLLSTGDTRSDGRRHTALRLATRGAKFRPESGIQLFVHRDLLGRIPL